MQINECDDRTKQEVMSEKIWAGQDLDGQSPQRVKRAEQVAGLMGIEPVDDLSVTKHKEGLQVKHRSEVRQAGQRSQW